MAGRKTTKRRATDTAAARLERWFNAEGWTQETAAEALGCHQTTLSKLLTRKRRPGLDLANRIEELSGDWTEGPITTTEWTADAATVTR